MTSQDQNYKVMRRRALTLAFQSRLAFATLVWLLIVTPTIVAAIPLLKWWGSKGNKQDGVISIAPVPSPPTGASKTKDVVATPPTDRFVTVAGGGPNLHRRQTATDPCLAAIPPCPAGYRCIKTRATNPAFMCAAADDTFCAGRCPAISASPALCPAMSLQFTTNNACIRGALSSCNWDRVSCPLIDCGEPGACLTSPPVPRACSDGRVPSVVRCEWDRVVNLCYWRIVDRCPTSSTTIFAVGISPPRSQTTAATQADAEYSTLYLSSQVLKSTTTVSTPPVVTGTNAATSSVAAAPTTAVSSTMTVASTTSSVTSSPATSTPVTPPSVSTKQTGLGTTATTSSSTTLASAATAPLPSTSSLVSPPASESSLSIPNIASDTSSATSLAHTDQPSAASSESATQSLSVPNTQFSTAAASPTLEVSTYIPSATLEPVTTTTGQGAGTTTSAASSTTSTTELDPLPSSTSAPGTLPSTELHSDPPAPETSAAAESITPVPTDILPAASTQTDQESIFTSSLPLSTRVTTTQEDEPPVLTDFVTLSSTSAISSTTDSASSTLIDGTLTGVFVPSTTTEVTPVSWVPGMSEDSAAASTSQKEASSFPSVSSILVPEMTATASSTSLATTVPEETAADTTSSVASTSGDSTSTAQTSGEEMSSSTIAQPTESAGSEESTTVAGLTSVEPVATSSDLELSTTVHSTATLPSAAQEPAPTGSSSTEAETISTSTSIQLETDVLTFSEPNPVSPTLSSTITDTETDILTFTPPPSSATQATSSTSGPTSTSTSQPLCVKPDCNPLACVPAGLLAEFNECRDPVTPHEECLALHGLCVPDETRAGQCGFEQPPAYWECMAAKLGPAGGSSSGLASSSSPSAVAASTMVSTDSESEAASMPSAGSETLEPTATLTMGVSAPAVTETLSATVVVPTVAVSESLGETAPATSTVTSDSEASSTADSPSITASISATMTLASTTQEPASVTVLDAATSESTSTSDSTPTTTPPSAVALPTILSSNTLVRLPVETQSFVTE